MPSSRRQWCARLAIMAVCCYVGCGRLYQRMEMDGMGARSSSGNKSHRSLAREIAARWNLTSPEAPHLLERQFDRADDYDPQKDFLHFHHVMKTGGTTISGILEKALGSDRILPGSEPSGSLKRENFYKRGGNDTDAPSFPYLVSYGHTRLRPVHGPRKTDLAKFFEEYFALPGNSRKRLRSLGMLREPTDLRASAHAMWMCGLNKYVSKYNVKREEEGLERICTPEQGLNISELIDVVVDRAVAKCPEGAKTKASEIKAIESQFERSICSKGTSALDHCRGPAQLLSSVQYERFMRSSLRDIMERFSAQQPMFGKSPAQKEPVIPSIAEVERYTLTDLGGLNVDIFSYADGVREKSRWTLLRAGTNDDDAEPDFLWFGTTERMKESACLLYYTLRIKPLEETPRSRVMQCSPTSWWSEEHREEVKRREPEDYAVWRAANAILDVRVWKMQKDIRNKLKKGRGSTREEMSRYKALEDAGCLDFR